MSPKKTRPLFSLHVHLLTLQTILLIAVQHFSLEVVSQKLHHLRVEDETDTVVKKTVSRHKSLSATKKRQKMNIENFLVQFYNYFYMLQQLCSRGIPFYADVYPLPVYFYPSLLLQGCLVPNDNAVTNFKLNVRNVNLSVVLPEPLL